ncbi:hypothetical protein TraAM80_02448 [Trypanosoma rangeli]|uniref:MGT2 magnesium transporter n=1 Tax=Trypanosoma rangeli TaxID=5698 RepID=A0A3R7L723_TRYRA|nr:uncharacterized protein TraAM80_02448 [Trypanosoma rangeli]RNF08903.1 hypothetical protein TraAM80_02448 [Trypanosoma rangeli]|eukprot:RNF08903.1 hypothetical protein TraAM80_02448 [Trypanosoma rangeli]
MKSRQRRGPRNAEVAFSYELFGSIDIDSGDVLNFTGENGSRPNRDTTQFLHNKSYAQGKETTSRQSLYLQFQRTVDVENGATGQTDDRNDSFVNLEDAAQHVWFLSQRSEGSMPFALNFTTSDQFLQYAKSHSLFSTAPRGSVEKAAAGPPKAAKWLDIQTTNETLLMELLSRFPLSEDTIDRCCYLDGMDCHLAHSTLGYFFFNLLCTPVTTEDEGYRLRQKKSVMQLSLESVMRDESHSSIAAAVPVAVIVFPEWIITVHEKPFHELGDLLKFLYINCGDHGSGTTTRRRRQVMTSPFIFASLFQITVGHQLDTASLITSLDRMGDYVFKVENDPKVKEEVLQRITDARRVFAECAAELTRREHIVSILLQPHMANSFLTQEKTVCHLLESSRAHLLRLGDEIADARDTLSVTNWYHNTARTWKILRGGNRATRQMLLLLEITNILYPVLAAQLLYTMNVPVPFQGDQGESMENTRAFFVVLAFILLYTLLCGRAVYALFHKKRWKTRLLA